MLPVGQLLWKIGLNQLGSGLTFRDVPLVLTSPSILGGFVVFGLSTLVYLFVLSRLQLSFVYPLFSLSYVVGVLLAYFVLHERITTMHWVSIGVIVVGVALLVQANA